MSDKKHQQAGGVTLPGEQGAGGSVVPLHHEHAVSIDLERLSADLCVGSTTDDVESQAQLAAAPVGEELQSSDGATTNGNGSNSSRPTATVGSSLMSNWRWIGQKELQYLVTNRRTPPPRPREDGPAGSIELGNEAQSSSSAAVLTEAPGDALDRGAFLRVVTESGVGIPAAFEGGSEGGRQRIAHILLPTTAESPERSQPGDLDNHAVSSSRGLPLAIASAAAAVTATGGKKRKVGSVVDRKSSLSQDLEKGKVKGDGGAEETASCYHHEDEDDSNEPLCRVCHMSTAKADVITLGCACKDDLGRAHRECAETWFQVRGNRQCEICGEVAQNVQLLEPMDETLTNINTPDAVVTGSVRHRATVCWQNRPIRNFLLVFLVAAFLVPWLFRFAYYNR